MKRIDSRWLLLGMILVAATAGCGKQPGTGGKGEKKKTGLELISSAELPKLKGPLSPLDEERIEIAAPLEWNILSRSRNYLTRFCKFNANNLPRILVTVEPLPDAEIKAVTRDNLDALVSLVRPRVADEELAEPVRPLLIDDRGWARYVRKGRLNNVSADRLFLVTVSQNRLYTIELQVYSGKLLMARDDAYAVAAGMTFLTEESPEPEETNDGDDAAPATDT